jgi:hypothetical protein
MKIAQSNVNLVSSHQYYEENTVSVQTGVLTRSTFLDNLQDQEKKLDTVELSSSAIDGEAIASENYNSLKPQKAEYLSNYDKSLEEQFAQLRSTLLDRILQLLRILGGDEQDTHYKSLVDRTSEMLTSNNFVSVTQVQMMHIEEESTTFSGEGTAITEDGRVIDFGVSFSLSSRLTQYANISMSSAVGLIDPLVINVGSDITHIEDQHFFFDLDSDGKDDKISNLAPGSGFLAYDKNGDGIINNGLELFGTKSGNGFKDLALHDSDNNGWIDENDEIYDKLSVWIRNADGTDSLLSLKEADVGAIYLGNAQTDFTHRNMDLAISAMTRASGLFLKESGGVGTVQQVDLAAVQDI